MQGPLYTADTIHLMIHIKAKKKHVQDVLAAAYQTISPTHKEEGCLEYRLIHNGRSVILTGKWKDEMSLNMHLLLQFHLQLIEETLPPLCKKIRVQTLKEIEPPITALSLG